ncbi:MAG: MFS transporter [Acidimicrobiia bacterium]
MGANAVARRVGGPAMPLLVLAGLNLTDEFDRIAFTALSPEIRDAFHLGDNAILALNVVPGVMILLAAGPIGRLADRFSRVHVSIGAALLWGVCAVLTALVPNVGLLLAVRTIAGIGRTANEIVHPSLLSDLYAEAAHPKVFQLHRLANPLAQGSGVVAGFLGAELGWTWAFYVLAVPTFVLVLLLRRIPDPGRRGVDPGAGGAPVGVRAAYGALRAVPSLRRFWAVAFFLSLAAFGMWALASLYFEQVWGYDAKGRGLVQFFIGIGWTAGVWLGGQVTQRRLEEGSPAALAAVCGNAFGLFAIGGVALAVAPGSVPAVVALTVLAIGNGVWQSPYFSAVGRLAPPGLSGQAFASTVIVYAVGGVCSLAIGAVGDATNYRVAFALIGAAGAVAALLARSVGPLIEADLAPAGR